MALHKLTDSTAIELDGLTSIVIGEDEDGDPAAFLTYLGDDVPDEIPGDAEIAALRAFVATRPELVPSRGDCRETCKVGDEIEYWQVNYKEWVTGTVTYKSDGAISCGVCLAWAPRSGYMVRWPEKPSRFDLDCYEHCEVGDEVECWDNARGIHGDRARVVSVYPMGRSRGVTTDHPHSFHAHRREHLRWPAKPAAPSCGVPWIDALKPGDVFLRGEVKSRATFVRLENSKIWGWCIHSTNADARPGVVKGDPGFDRVKDCYPMTGPKDAEIAELKRQLAATQASRHDALICADVARRETGEWSGRVQAIGRALGLGDVRLGAESHAEFATRCAGAVTRLRADSNALAAVRKAVGS